MQLEQAERKLEESKNQLSRLRGRENLLASEEKLKAGMVNVKVDKGSTSPYQTISHPPENQSGSVLEPLQGSVKSSRKSEVNRKGGHSETVIQNSEGSSQNKTMSRTQNVTPSVNPVTPQSSKSYSGIKTSNDTVSVPIPTHTNTVKSSGVRSRKISHEQDCSDVQSKGTKRKFGNAVTCHGFNFTCLFELIAAITISVTQLLQILHDSCLRQVINHLQSKKSMKT